MKEVIKEFIGDLKSEKFAKAHEIMEKKWKEYKKLSHSKTKLLKGFINGATAFELVKRKNLDGAKRLWSVYEKYLPLLDKSCKEYELFVKADEILQKLKKERLS